MSASHKSITEKRREIPAGYCQCGCGRKTKIAPETNRRYGYVKGQPLRFIHGHNTRGVRNPNYNMGLTLRKKDGKYRWMICCRDGTKVYYARAVMEAHLGRTLDTREHVHHINGDPLDDRLENLQLLGKIEHHKTHIDYSDDDLLERLRTLAKVLGRIPKETDLYETPGMPMPKTYTLRFGTWFRALQAAGLISMDPEYASLVQRKSRKRQVKGQ